jgi:CRISPR/Cas system-associated exonuclease Cas4 (RecB family)
VPQKKLPVIRASEVGEYVYCARAWWLHRVAGEEPTGHERRERGVELHARHGQQVIGSSLLLWLAVLLLIAAIVMLVLGR